MHCTHRAYELSRSLRAPRRCLPSLRPTNNGPVRSVTQTQRGRSDGRRGEPGERRRREGGIFARVAARGQFSCDDGSLEAREGHREDCGQWYERRTSVPAGRAYARIVRVTAWTAAGDGLGGRGGRGPDRGGCGRPRERVGAHASWSHDGPAQWNASPSVGAGSSLTTREDLKAMELQVGGECPVTPRARRGERGASGRRVARALIISTRGACREHPQLLLTRW